MVGKNLIEMNTPVKYLKGVGEKRAVLLGKLGVFTVGDLLALYPRTYDDRSKIVRISDGVPGEIVTVKAFAGTIPRENKIRKGFSVYKLEVSDGINLMDLTFFNNKYTAESIELGVEYLFTGKLQLFKGHYSMNSPKVVRFYEGMDDLSPVYPQTSGLNSKTISKLIRTALETVSDIEDCIPLGIREEYCLMPYAEALRNIHFPHDEDLRCEAQRRLSFEELLILQLGMSRLKIKSLRSTSCIIKTDYSEEFFSILPFELTAAQQRVIRECVTDMSRGVPMNRLVQGDVGSGKTVVSAALVYNCIRNGFQAALMAPTEVLAQQHFKSFSSFFSNTGIKAELITGSTSVKEKRAIKERLKAGETDFIIGTHTLIQKDVEFSRLALCITDEQHRFGVNQRVLFGSKGENPHVLVMSATPIPRTLSLIIYGDLDISIIDEMPKGRQKVETYLVNASLRERAYGYVKKHLIEGRQGYIVCPLIETEENDEMTAAKDLYKELSNGYFNGFKIGLLYGKMKPADKKTVMDEFAYGKLDLLVSTTVIEVGVDVPNSVIMVIENAERFGLSQLHQLRGRIGRGKYKSTCILISDSSDETTLARLNVIVSTSDGFKIADEDLKLRGPGDFFGTRQHGLPEMKIADMLKDGEVIRETHFCAEKMLENNPTLEGTEYDKIKKRVNMMFSSCVSMN